MKPIKEIEIEGKKAIVLFDTGATYTYVTRKFVDPASIRRADPFKVGLGGKVIDVNEICLINGKIEGFGFHTDAIPIDEIGVVDGYKLDAIIDSLSMERWEIKIDPKNRCS